MAKHPFDDDRRGAWARCRLGVSGPRITRYGIQTMGAIFVAAALRRKAVFYVYPLVNPDGRFTLRGRGNPELAAAGIKDHNRVWRTSGEFTTIDFVATAMRKDTGGSADYVLDFHSTSSNHFRVVKDFADSPYSQAITTVGVQYLAREST